MAMFNPRYAQLLQQKGLASVSLNSNLIPTANPIARTLAGNQTPPQNNRDTGGFGGRFKDSPPPFVEEVKVDNKIERTKKPKPKKKKKVVKKNKK
tara:strand:+ start:280 stop:564 length:285 start_codon:yes stop_codon:yes gene_type:complete